MEFVAKEEGGDGDVAAVTVTKHHRPRILCLHGMRTSGYVY